MRKVAVNLDNLFDSLMRNTQKARNNRVSKVLNSKNLFNSSKELKFSQNESKVMEISDSNEYTWGIIGENSVKK